MEPELPIEFFLNGIPVSLQSSPRGIAAWKLRVTEAVEAALPEGSWLLQQPLSVQIILLLDDDLDGDLDNTIKPILDAMNRVVFDDDQQVAELNVAKYHKGRVFIANDPSETLAAALDHGPPIVYVKISEDTNNAN